MKPSGLASGGYPCRWDSFFLRAHRATLFAADTGSPSAVQVSVVRATKRVFLLDHSCHAGSLVAADEAIMISTLPGFG